MQFYVILEERFKGPGPSCKISQKTITSQDSWLVYERTPSGEGGSKDPFTYD